MFRLLSFVIDFIKIYSELWTTVQTESEKEQKSLLKLKCCFRENSLNICNSLFFYFSYIIYFLCQVSWASRFSCRYFSILWGCIKQVAIQFVFTTADVLNIVFISGSVSDSSSRATQQRSTLLSKLMNFDVTRSDLFYIAKRMKRFFAATSLKMPSPPPLFDQFSFLLQPMLNDYVNNNFQDCDGANYLKDSKDWY